jgi:N-dimethylarginine dimethylaminohydrolase
MFWLDERTLAIGLGFRTNAAGVRQIAAALKPLGARVLPVELPYYTGPAACLHLLSLISLVDQDMALVYPPLMSVPFWQELRRRGFRLIECPEAEFATMGTNVQALAPAECLMLEGNPITRERLQAAGCEVQT